jgi:hypothetical protein
VSEDQQSHSLVEGGVTSSSETSSSRQRRDLKYVKVWKEQNYGIGSRRGLKPITNVLARTSTSASCAAHRVPPGRQEAADGEVDKCTLSRNITRKFRLDGTQFMVAGFVLICSAIYVAMKRQGVLKQRES